MVVVVRFLEPFTVLADLAGAVENSRAVFERLNTIITAEAADQPAPAPAPPKPRPRIQFRDVAFRYRDAGEHVLRGINFTLEPGTTTAIIGPSGSGKSTILSLIAGLQEPESGQILIDGTDIAALDPATRRAQVSMIFQHPYLFDGPIRDNILVGHPGANEQQTQQAIALARVDEIIQRLPTPTKPVSVKPAPHCREESVSASASPVPCSNPRPYCSSTKPPVPWTPRTRRQSPRPSVAIHALAPK